MAGDPENEGDATVVQAVNSGSTATKEEQLEQLIATATANYAQKQYHVAAETYSRATELQAEIHGEMAPQNADLLYAYGRCLYHVAVQNSEVLGSKLAGESKSAPAKKKEKSRAASSNPNAAETAPTVTAPSAAAESAKTEELVEAVVEQKEAASGGSGDQAASKPYFIFTGDEGYDESDEEDGEDAEEEAPAEVGDEEDDDFSNAFEVLDLARVLFERRIQEQTEGSKDGGEAVSTRQLEERLADTYDLQAEISLEGEQFSNAATDLRSALKMKLALYPFESSLVAEAHYKLSLALEFAAVTHHKDANGEIDSSKPATVDQKMRNEAAEQMEQAIASCKSRVEQEESNLANSEADKASSKSKITRQSIDDVKEMIVDMEQRLTELRQAPVTVNDPRGTGAPEGASDLNGILGAVLGESSEEQKKRIETAMQQATDLTGLVKKKKRKADDPPGTGTETPEKRARTEDAEGEKTS